MTPRKTTTIDPSWSKILKQINSVAAEMDRLTAQRDKVAGRLDALVHEAVDDGERYRDIGKAANRSVAWVQTVLRRLHVDGPRVRLLSRRAAEAKRLRDDDKRLGRSAAADPLEDLLP